MCGLFELSQTSCDVVIEILFSHTEIYILHHVSRYCTNNV